MSLQKGLAPILVLVIIILAIVLVYISLFLLFRGKSCGGYGIAGSGKCFPGLVCKLHDTKGFRVADLGGTCQLPY